MWRWPLLLKGTRLWPGLFFIVASFFGLSRCERSSGGGADGRPTKDKKRGLPVGGDCFGWDEANECS